MHLYNAGIPSGANVCRGRLCSMTNYPISPLQLLEQRGQCDMLPQFGHHLLVQPIFMDGGALAAKICGVRVWTSVRMLCLLVGSRWDKRTCISHTLLTVLPSFKCLCGAAAACSLTLTGSFPAWHALLPGTSSRCDLRFAIEL